MNPNVQDYKENQDQPGIEIRQVMVATNIEQTKTLKFDFKKNNTHEIEIDDKKYEIKLMQIGREKLQGQNFSYFEFFVKWEDK